MIYLCLHQNCTLSIRNRFTYYKFVTHLISIHNSNFEFHGACNAGAHWKFGRWRPSASIRGSALWDPNGTLAIETTQPHHCEYVGVSLKTQSSTESGSRCKPQNIIVISMIITVSSTNKIIVIAYYHDYYRYFHKYCDCSSRVAVIITVTSTNMIAPGLSSTSRIS